jgi:hypothetical protein
LTFPVIAKSKATKQSIFAPMRNFWIASRSLSSGAHSRDPLVCNDAENNFRKSEISLDGLVETGTFSSSSRPQEGRLAIVTGAGRDAVDAKSVGRGVGPAGRAPSQEERP